jgi:hypothetical protein
MAYFAGLRGTGSFGTDERPKEFREMILWSNPNGKAPLFALTAKAKTESLTDPEFAWWEETQTICRLAINNGGGYNDSAVTLTVDGGDARELIAGDLLQVEPTTETAAYAPEILRVTSVTNATTIVVVRASAGTSAAALADNQALFRIGNAQGEGTLSVGHSSTNPTKFSNYTQIFKTPYGITKTAKATKYRTGDPIKNDQKRKSFQHAEKIEQALFWGVASETNVTQDGETKILRTTRGIRSFVTSNNYIFGVRPDMEQILERLAPVFNEDAGNAGNERIAFCGNRALMTFASLAEDNIHVQQDGHVKYYGMDFTKFIIPQGTIYLKSHPLMNVHPVYEASMFVMPGNGIIYRPLSGRDTHVEKNIQPNDADYLKDQWLTEAGFEFHFEKTWAYLGGLR